MFHLVKNVYLRYEEHLDYQEDCLYISKHDNYQYNEQLGKMLKVEFGDYYPKMYAYANSIGEMTKQYGGEESFFDMLVDHKGYLENGRLYIFCDSYNFRSIVIKWWRTLLPNLDMNDAYRLFELYKNRAFYANRESNIFLDDSQEFHSKYWDMDKESFEFIYNNTTPFSIKESVKEHASLEFHLASYYCDGLTKPFARKIRHFYRKRLIDEVAETKKDLERRLYFLSGLVNDEFEISFDYADLEKIKEKYPVFGDSEIKQSIDSFYYLESNYDVPVVVKAMMDAHIDLMLLHGRKDIDPASTLAMQLYVDCDGEPSVEQILDEESRNSYYVSIFFKMADHNKVNLFLLQEIFYLKEQDRLDELKRYCL